tara:strand:- start:75 stop:3653 length:3579 start_codon:yes stop_codon:yes gene_type:complete
MADFKLSDIYGEEDVIDDNIEVVKPDVQTTTSDFSSNDLYTDEDAKSYVPPAPKTVQDLGYKSTESRLADIRETPPESSSMKSLEQDDELVSEILQYRKDRYGVEKDVKANNLLFGTMFGGQELTNENVVDDFMDNYRFISGNSLDASTEITWLKSLQQKEEDAEKAGEVDKANGFAQQRERALRLYQKADSVKNLFNSDRYEGMNALETIADIADNVGGNVLAALSDPLTPLTAGIGRAVTGTARAVGVSPFRQAMKAAGITFGVEAAGAAVTDIMIQTAEIEMGAKKEIDYGRTVTVAGIGGLTAGTIAGIGKYNAEKKVGIATRGELDAAWAKVRENQTEAALKKNLELGIQSDDIRENLAKGITNLYGEKSIVRYKEGPKKGKIKGIDSEVIKSHPNTKNFFKNLDLDEDLVEPTISFDIFERTTAAVSEIVAGLKDGKLKLVDNPDVIGDGVSIKSLTSPLQAKERVSERLLNITSNMSEESLDEMTSIMGKYGVTRREIAAAMFTDASMAGKVLGNLSALQKNFSKAARRKTGGEVAEELDAKVVDKFGSTFRRLEDIRRLTLVSGVATATRNTLSQTLRSGVDTLVYGFESAINPNKRFGFKNTIAQLKHTYGNQEDAGNVAQFMLDAFPEQKVRYYNQYSEVKNTLNKKNPGQASLADKQSKLSEGSNYVLDKWESGITTLNYFNRLQEAIYRNGAFTTSIQRQLFNTGTDMVDVLKKGTLTENIDENMIAKAVDDALEFTYASQPKFSLFRQANNFIVKSGLTLAIPFPRFMFKAIEMTYNYNITGAGTALFRMGASKLKGNQISDGMYRQLSEGIAGGLPLISLGYLLRDPDGQTAGSEWYNLKDGKGNEYDARPFFPITPYLLIGEMIHRGFNPDLVNDFGSKRNVGEMIEGFTGTNFRGKGPISLLTEDLLSSSTDPLEMQDTYNNLGRYIGEATSGYLQPFYQIADFAAAPQQLGIGDGYQRQRDYNADPKKRESIESFFLGVFKPFKSRLSRIGEAVGLDQDDIPFKEDPRFEEVPERILPFMKIMFGATLNRVPPNYVQRLNQLGFTYRDFMARSSSPLVDKLINKEMGEAMNREIPEVLATALEEKLSTNETASRVRDYIKTVKQQIRAEVITGTDDAILSGLITRYRGNYEVSKRAALESFKKEFKREPDFFVAEDVQRMLDYTTTKTFYSKQRK